MYVLALSDYKQPAAAAGYKPAPQLGSSPTRIVTEPFMYSQVRTHRSQRLLMREEVPSLAYPEDERRTDDDDDPIDEA